MDHDKALRNLISERGMLQVFIRTMMSDYQLVEDIIQETFVVVLKKRDDFREGTNFAAWVREIARRVALSQIRKAAKRPTALDPVTLDALEGKFDTPADQWEAERAALAECVDRLDEDQRRVLMLWYAENTPLKRIATLVGRTYDGVKALLKRLRQALIQCTEQRLRQEGSAT